MANPADVQAAFCAVLVDEWARAGVTEAVLAPGSRSTPLVLALAAEPRVRCHVVLDERSAGFVALGLGLATGRPAVAVTTSGTAASELHPAVVEASQAGVPLIAATADRPSELHKVGAPQTIEQESLFAAAVRWAASPGVADPSAAGSWRSLASRAVAEATAGPLGPGPVHLNLAFREPLLGTPVDVPPGRDGGRPWHVVTAGESAVDVRRLSELPGRRGLVVAGGGSGHPGVVVDACGRLGWPLLADPRSGCRVTGGPVIAAADALLRVPEIAAWTPEVVVRLGAPWASKVVSQWLARLGADVRQILVDPWGRWQDPERAAGEVIEADPTAVMRALGQAANATADRRWVRGWVDAESAAQGVLEGHLAGALSEPAVARAAVAALPADGQLVVSSSMPVRDVEWYSAPRNGVRVFANRGANGIDGVIATAAGVAVANGCPTVALVGDLAFLYDAGALQAARRMGADLTVVVVDNDGGGIFSFLPQAATLPAVDFERYWGTPHGLDVGVVAAAYGAEVHSMDQREDLDKLLSTAGGGGVRVGVVRSDRDENVRLHDRLHEAVRQAVADRLRDGAR